MKSLLIVGGGVIGLSTACASAQRGFRVTVVDRRDESYGGATAGNAGMIVPSHFVTLAAPGMVRLALKWMRNPESPLYMKPRLNGDLIGWGLKFWRAATPEHVQRSAPVLRDLHLASRELFIQFARNHDIGLVEKGLLMLCKTQHALEEEAHTADHARRLGVPADVLDARQTAALDPNVRMDIAGSVYFPKDCHLVPEKFLGALREQARELGVEFLWSSEVTGFSRSPGRVSAARVGTREIKADEFLICGGSWTPDIGRTLGLRIPVQAGKGYSLTLRTPRQLPQICSIFTEARVAATPMDGALRFGGTMEIAGLNEDITRRRVSGIINAVPRYYPEFSVDDFAGIEPWRGLRPCSPDGLPYLGRTKRLPNVSIATGHGMMGLSLAPITGKLIGEILAGEQPSIDVSLLNPDRYA